MASRTSLEQRLAALIDKFQPRLRAAYLAAVQDIVSTVQLARVVKAIEQGDYVGAFQAIGFNGPALRPLTSMIEQAFEAGGIMVAGTAPRNAVFRFDVRNSRAEKWLREQSSSLVTRLSEDTRVAVRNVMTDGMAAGRNPQVIALDLVGRKNLSTGRREGGIVGLSAPQERYVANMRRDLENLDERYFTRGRRDKRFDSIVRKAIKEGKPLGADTVDKLTGRYKDNLLKLRGDTIARTEAISSLNRSEHEALAQAREQGLTNTVKRAWDSAGDDGKTRESHLIMDGQTVGPDEPFTTPDGFKLMFPGDTSLGAPPEETINCRCRVRTIVDWLQDLD